MLEAVNTVSIRIQPKENKPVGKSSTYTPIPLFNNPHITSIVYQLAEQKPE
jgi:hypothetical protein